MKNVLLWIVSIFSMILDAVKKERQVYIVVPEYSMHYNKTMNHYLVKKGEHKLIIIRASLKNAKAFEHVQGYAENNNMVIVGTYIEDGKRNFILKKVED